MPYPANVPKSGWPYRATPIVAISVAESVRTGSVSTGLFQTFDVGKGRGHGVRYAYREMFGAAATDPLAPKHAATSARTTVNRAVRRAGMTPILRRDRRGARDPMVPNGARLHPTIDADERQESGAVRRRRPAIVRRRTSVRRELLPVRDRRADAPEADRLVDPERAGDVL